MKIQGVYVIRNTISGHVYVGSTRSVKGRWATHRHSLAKGKHYAKLLQQSWTTHGPSAFTFEVLEIVANVADLTAREQHWIDTLSAFDPTGQSGFNSYPMAGSPKGHKMSPERRAKLSAERTGVKKTPEHAAKLAPARNEGRKRWLAKIRSDPDAAREHGAKLSAAFKGRTLSAEHLAKLAAVNRGKIVSPETRAKQAEAQKERYAREVASGISRFGRGV